MKTFDRHRPHGTVYGSSEIAWEQDGQQFRPDGSMIDWDEVKAEKADEITQGMDEAAKALEKARRSQAIKEGIARKRAQQEA